MEVILEGDHAWSREHERNGEEGILGLWMYFKDRIE